MGCVFGIWCDGDGPQQQRGVEGADLVVQVRQKVPTDKSFGSAVHVGDVERCAQQAAEFTDGDHGKAPLSAGAMARRRTIVWRHGNAGQTDRGFLRRTCAVFLREQ